jgi:DNA-binding LacI/PurR family transcriptional regulator
MRYRALLQGVCFKVILFNCDRMTSFRMEVLSHQIRAFILAISPAFNQPSLKGAVQNEYKRGKEFVWLLRPPSSSVLCVIPDNANGGQRQTHAGPSR